MVVQPCTPDESLVVMVLPNVDLGIAATVLIPVTTIVYATALVMDSGVRMRLSSMESEHSGLRGVGRK